MKTKFVILIILFVMILGIGVWVMYWNMRPVTFLPENDTTPQNAIIIDSIQVKDKKVYWLCYDLGIRDFSVGKLAEATSRYEISEENIFMNSSHVTGLEYHEKTNELVIHVFRNKYGYESDTSIEDVNISFTVRLVEDGDSKNSIASWLRKVYK